MKWSATSITVVVPSGATTGNVVVTVGGQASYGVLFTVTAPAPSGMLQQGWPTIGAARRDIFYAALGRDSLITELATADSILE